MCETFVLLSQGETMFFAHIRNQKYDTVCIFASYIMKFLCFVCSGHHTSTRDNVPYISLPWASWTYIPSIHPRRSSCISQLSCLLHLCVCCQVCQFSIFSKYIRNSVSLSWLICEVIYMLNVFLILNIEKTVHFFLYSQIFHPMHTVDQNLPTFVVSMKIVCAVSKLGTHNCHSTVRLEAAMLYIRFWYLASLT